MSYVRVYSIHSLVARDYIHRAIGSPVHILKLTFYGKPGVFFKLFVRYYIRLANVEGAYVHAYTSSVCRTRYIYYTIDAQPCSHGNRQSKNKEYEKEIDPARYVPACIYAMVRREAILLLPIYIYIPTW